MAFAVVGTRLKTNGRSTGKQSGTKGWSGRCKEEKEVGPRTRQKKTKKDPKKTDFFGGGQLKRLKDARSVADCWKGKGEEGSLKLKKKYFYVCSKRFLQSKKEILLRLIQKISLNQKRQTFMIVYIGSKQVESSPRQLKDDR